MDLTEAQPSSHSYHSIFEESPRKLDLLQLAFFSPLIFPDRKHYGIDSKHFQKSDKSKDQAHFKIHLSSRIRRRVREQSNEIVLFGHELG